jgi:hypothetical protein
LKVIITNKGILEKSSGGMESTTDDKFSKKYDHAKEIILKKPSKVLSGQQFLVKKLSKAKADPHIETKMKRLSSKFMTEEVIPSKADAAQYLMVPLMPDLVAKDEVPGEESESSEEIQKTEKNRDPFEKMPEEDILKNLFVINLCALLRILYNASCLQKENLSIKHLLNDKVFMTQMNKACNFAGWHNGFLSSKFLRLVKYAVDDSSTIEGGSTKNFSSLTGYYHLVFKSLSNVLDYFLQKFKKENLKIFRQNEINLLNEIIRTAVTAMMTVKAAIIADVAASQPGGDPASAGNSEEKKFYDVYSDNQDTPLKELMRWVMSTYVPPRFIEIFVELLTRIEARVQEVEFKFKRTLVAELLKFIAEYLSFFPNRRYDLIKHFYDTQTTQGVKVRASMLHDILKNSYFSSKMQRIIEYMNTKEAGDGYLDKEKDVVFYSYGYYGAVKGKIFPIFVVMTKAKLYLLKETLEKAFEIASLESLSPYPPRCLAAIEYKEVKEVFHYPDYSSVRIKTRWNSHLIDFVSTYEKIAFMGVFSKLLAQDETATKPTMNELPESLSYGDSRVDHLFSCAIFESSSDSEKRTFTDVVVQSCKHLLLIVGNSMHLYEIDLSEEGCL